MTAREWVYNTLTADPGVDELVDGRIFSNESMMTAQVVKPFIVLKFGADADAGEFDDPDIVQRPHRQFLEVWVHDSRPSYIQIDLLIGLVKQALRTSQMSAPDYIIAVKYLETSADMNDPSVDTVLKYSRYQLIMSQ